MDYHIEELSNKNAADWKRVNEENKEGGFFHTLEWERILERSFNYKTYCFLLYRNGEPVALCPFYEASINGVRGLISLPDSDCNHIIIKSLPEDNWLSYMIPKKQSI